MFAWEQISDLVWETDERNGIKFSISATDGMGFKLTAFVRGFWRGFPCGRFNRLETAKGEVSRLLDPKEFRDA